MQLTEQFLRRFAVAGAGQLLQLVEHLLQPLAIDCLEVGLRLRQIRYVEVLQLLEQVFGESVEKPVKRLAQLLDQLGDLFFVGVARQRLLQTLLNFAQILFGQRQRTVFHAQRRFPQQGLHRLDRTFLFVVNQARTGGHQTQKHADIVAIAIGSGGNTV